MKSQVYSMLILIIASVFLALPGDSIDAMQITVGPNVQVSKDRPEHHHSEVWAGADFNNPDHLLVCGIASPRPWNDPQETTNIQYVSRDRGKTWEPTLEIPESSDPVCEFGPNGVAYTRGNVDNTGVSDPKKGYDFWYRSLNGGLTWEPPVRAGLHERPAFASDNSGGKYHGRVYMIGERNVAGSGWRLALYRSLDSGRTFLGPVIGPDPFALTPGHSAVLSDGTIVIPGYRDPQFRKWRSDFKNPMEMWEDENQLRKSELYVVRSIDGGKTLLPVVKIDSGISNSIMSLAADPGSRAFKDRIYVVWVGRRSIQPPEHPTNRMRILLSYSSDKGKTWSYPVIVDDSRESVEGSMLSFSDRLGMPVVKVNHNGVVGVTWYDNIDGTGFREWDTRFAASFDGGETFTPSVRVSSERNEWLRPDKIIHASSGGRTSAIYHTNKLGFPYDIGGVKHWMKYGDTRGMAVGADGTFYPVWVDNRTGAMQIWTAPVIAHGVVARNGSLELSRLVDVTEKIDIKGQDVIVDRASETIKFSIKIKNISKDIMYGPFKVRLMTLWSAVGIVSTSGADNKVDGVGAVWDLSKHIRKGVLAPGEESELLPLTYTIRDIKLFGPDGIRAAPFVRSEFRVLVGAAGNE